MSRMKSQIPRLKPASSCGNLTRISSNINLSIKSPNDNPKTTGTADNTLNRQSMIDAPIPVTHRRMCGQYQLTKPPWATDDSINPFDRNSDFAKPKRTQSSHIVQHFVPPEVVLFRTSSPASSQDNSMDFGKNHSYFDNDSIYRTEVHNFLVPRPTSVAEAIQTDISGLDLVPSNLKYNSETKSTASNQEKRSTVHPRELKRNDQRNNLTYRINGKNVLAKELSDSNNVHDDVEEAEYRSQEEIQSRIDYWLKKSLELQNNNEGNVNDTDKSDTEKPKFRNQITFTPRNTQNNRSNGFSHNSPSNDTSPETIEALIVESDSGSERDNIVTSRSLESRSPKFKSRFRIQANLSPRMKSPIKKEVSEKNTQHRYSQCGVCKQDIQTSNHINSSGICCHRECFICFWCKKRLSLENYKINSNKLCCPLHFRLTGSDY